MASYKALFILVIAMFAVTFATEEAREKRGIVYGGYGAYPYASYGHHGYSGLGYGYGLGYHGLGYHYLH